MEVTKQSSTSLKAPAGNSRRHGFRNGPATGSAPWYRIQNSAAGEVEINIFDQIGKDWWTGDGIAAKDFLNDLAKVPKGQEIKLFINSPGGSVHDGMAIYTKLKERRANLTVKVVGVAASIASVLALAGRSLEIPENALFMIHDPWGYVQGNAEDMRKAAQMLDVHRNAIASVYVEKTGKTVEEINALMSDETWYEGAGAVEAGFADKTSEEIVVQASFDLKAFRNVPQQLQNLTVKAAANKENDMNKAQIIARLKKLGVAYDESASIETLKALLETAETAAQDAAELAEFRAAKASKAKEATAPPPPAAAAAADPALAKAVDDVATIKAQLAAERALRITARVDALIAADKIPLVERAEHIADAMANEKRLDQWENRIPNTPGGKPLNISMLMENPKDIAKGVLGFREGIKSWQRGNSVPMAEISANAIAMARTIAKHRTELMQVLNTTNTIDDDLKRNICLDDMMRDFKRRLVQLGIFTTRFTNIPLQKQGGNNKVVLPYYANDSVASTNFVTASGYLFTENTETSERSVTIDKRKYKTVNFTSEEFARQPYLSMDVHLGMKAEKLALDVWLDILSIITQDNFGVPILAAEPATFDVNDIIQANLACNNADWPEIGRALVLSSTHEAALLSDDSLKNADKAGSDRALRAGSTQRLINFDMFYSPRIPTNGEDLGGFACLPPAVLVATAPIQPSRGVMHDLLSYDLVVDPDTGIAFEYKFWGSAQADREYQVVECNYGYNKGTDAALKRITLGSADASSSSSISSSQSSSSS